MREILFRGKRKDNGQFIEGFYIFDGFNHYIVKFYTDENAEGTLYPVQETFEVDPETVGQYTGLTDKNGKKIFEGDIVRTYRNRDDFDLMMVEWYEDSAGFVLAPQKRFRYYESLTNSHIYLEVIGNIHDTPPEFLEVPHE